MNVKGKDHHRKRMTVVRGISYTPIGKKSEVSLEPAAAGEEPLVVDDIPKVDLDQYLEIGAVIPTAELADTITPED